jgi:DNA (cytosine-5)-methyltransferase 1
LPKPPRRKTTLADIIEWDAADDDDERRKHVLSLVAPQHQRKANALSAKGDCVLPGYRRTRHGHQVLELRFDENAGCLRTPCGGSSRQVLLLRRDGKPWKTRLLTVRETARLMGASDKYVLPERYNDGYRAMGDAVAVPAASYLAKHLLAPLAETVMKECI